jgi:hypothetical protein
VSDKRVLIADERGGLSIYLRTTLADAGIAADVQWQKGPMQSYDVVLCWDAVYAAHLSARYADLCVLPHRQKRTSAAKLVAAIRNVRNAPH